MAVVVGHVGKCAGPQSRALTHVPCLFPMIAYWGRDPSGLVPQPVDGLVDALSQLSWIGTVIESRQPGFLLTLQDVLVWHPLIGSLGLIPFPLDTILHHLLGGQMQHWLKDVVEDP